MFPNYNRLCDPNCELIFFKYQWLLTPKLSCLSQHTGEIIMSVKIHCRCDLPGRSSLIRVNSFIKYFNLIFSKKWAFVHPAKLSSGLLSSGILSSGLLS